MSRLLIFHKLSRIRLQADSDFLAAYHDVITREFHFVDSGLQAAGLELQSALKS